MDIFPIFAEGNPLGFLDDFGVNGPLLVSQGVSFAIVACALYYFAFRPVMKVADERRAKIAQGLKDAERAKTELEQSSAKALEISSKAARDAAEVLNEARRDAKLAVEKAAADAAAKAEEIRLKNAEALAQDKARMKLELKGELSSLVAEAAVKLANDVLTPEQKAKLAQNAANAIANSEDNGR